MTREELLRSNEYWIGEIQQELFELIEVYLNENNLSRIQFAEKLGVTKGYVSQILNGNFDHRLSKFVELALSVGKVPRVKFIDTEQILKMDEMGVLHDNLYESINIELKFDPDIGISLSNTIKLKEERINKPKPQSNFIYNDKFENSYIAEVAYGFI